jgi:hypothetical protein
MVTQHSSLFLKFGDFSCSANPNLENEVDHAIDMEDEEYGDILRIVCSVD